VFVGQFLDEPIEERFEPREIDAFHLRTLVALVDAVMIVVSENRVVSPLPPVVECVLDTHRELLRDRNTEDPDPDDVRPAITASVTDNRDIVGRRFIRHLLVLSPSY
jgi:hypothetical protein